MIKNGNIQFWLQISPALIIDNFDNLITYLKQYTFDDESLPNNADYIATIEVMLDMSHAYSDLILKSPHKLPDLDVSYETVIRLLAATILGAYKMHCPANELFLPLINLEIMLTPQISDIEYEKLSRIISQISLGRKIRSMGFTFFQLEKYQFNIAILWRLLLTMTFDTSRPDTGMHVIENKGSVIFRQGMAPVIFAGNVNDFTSKHGKSLFIDIPNMISFMTPSKEDCRTNSFDAIVKSSKAVSRLQDTVKAVRRQLRDYNPADEFIVKITRKRNYSIIAETISRDHNKLSGKLNYQPGTTVGYLKSTFMELLQEGDYVRVSLERSSDEFEFTTADTFENFYLEKASRYPLTKNYAVYEKQLSKYTIFVSADGIRINLYKGTQGKYNDDQYDAFRCAVEDKLPALIHVNDSTGKVYDNRDSVLYGNIDFNGARLESDDEDFFTLDDANRNLLDDFLDDCDDEASHIVAEAALTTETIERLSVSPYLAILMKMRQEGYTDAMTRVKHAAVGLALSKIMDSPECEALFDAEIKAAAIMVQFARGDRPDMFKIEESLLADEHTRCQAALIDTLKEYAPGDAPEHHDDDNRQKVKKLIEASNNLNGILDSQELLAIKRIITRILGVEDEFIATSTTRSYYGVESDTLEFKSSIVFPPTNRRRIQSAVADPSLQKWAIIKTVDGFLNSRSGGDLLLGIRDSGYALGLDNDISELYRRQLIPFKSIDSYRTYVQNIIDYAFEIEQNSSIAPESITRPLISYHIENSLEEIEFLRIKIAPYRKGIVLIKKTHDRPMQIEDSYLRLSGRTVPVTKEMRYRLLKNKDL